MVEGSEVLSQNFSICNCSAITPKHPLPNYYNRHVYFPHAVVVQLDPNHHNQRKSKTHMKKTRIEWSKNTKQVVETGVEYGSLARRAALAGAALTSLLIAAQSAHAGSIFYILMENHNLTQPTNITSPQQILGNPAAPYINSLMTPGNSNAVQSSWATLYFNAGKGVHPSEPNYVWAEAGTDFGVHTDADPNPTNHNVFLSNHLSAQFNAAGVTWRNYQEDVELSTSPTNSASGSHGPTNAFNGTTQFNYAVKHNPEGFFPDTFTANVFPLAQLFLDLSSNSVAQFSYITPNQFNDAHSALSGGFTYLGTHYTGDQAAVAQGDNFLSQIVPQIMASPAYQNNGAIVIWWDETEKGDSIGFKIPEIVISPLSKGNAYASSVQMSHSSDIKTWEELFGFSFLNNPIPVSETNINGGYNNVATVNDLSDLFQDGVVPTYNLQATVQVNNVNAHGKGHGVVRIQNTGSVPVPGPLFLVLDELTENATLSNPAGTTSVLAPLGSPYVQVNLDGNSLAPGDSAVVQLDFADPSLQPIGYTTRVLPVTPTP
jgi:hypothetical protein